jgi:transcriptional regulator with XRE-family HTH domain
MLERLRQLRSALKISQRDFSEKIKVAQATYAMFEKGQRVLKDIHISQICQAFGVNEHWLRTGEGEMFAASSDAVITDLCAKYGFSSIERKMLEAYCALDAKYREGVTRYLENLVASIAGEKSIEEEAAEQAEAYRQEYISAKKRQTSSASDTGSERTAE